MKYFKSLLISQTLSSQRYVEFKSDFLYFLNIYESISNH